MFEFSHWKTSTRLNSALSNVTDFIESSPLPECCSNYKVIFYTLVEKQRVEDSTRGRWTILRREVMRNNNKAEKNNENQCVQYFNERVVHKINYLFSNNVISIVIKYCRASVKNNGWKRDILVLLRYTELIHASLLRPFDWPNFICHGRKKNCDWLNF